MGQTVVGLMKEIEAKFTRLRNKARLVGKEESPGRNLTALRNTVFQTETLLRLLRERCDEIRSASHVR